MRRAQVLRRAPAFPATTSRSMRCLIFASHRADLALHSWVNETAYVAAGIISQLAAAADSARLNERNPFPRFAEPRVYFPMLSRERAKGLPSLREPELTS